MTTTGPGRPRHTDPGGAREIGGREVVTRQAEPRTAGTGGTSTREQILDAAAALFLEHGLAATSTRMIAERVGIRQASLYYHFAGKDELLMELLSTSVRPSLDAVRDIEAGAHDRVSAAAALHRLACTDVDTLARTRHNIGTMYLLPETLAERYEEFHEDRAELARSYGRLGLLASTDEVLLGLGDRLGPMLIQLVEVVIQIRRVRDPDATDTLQIAASCLRLCGLDAVEVGAAEVRSAELARQQ